MSAQPERRCWRALCRHHEEVKDLHLRELFAADPGRCERLVAEAADLQLGYSKNRITAKTIRLLLALPEECDLHEGIGAMFCGNRINVSENCSVLHVALRMPRNRSLIVDGTDVVAQVHRAA